MVSLKTRTRAELTDYINKKLKKMANMVDEDDVDLAITDSVRRLDEILFNPRNTLIQADRSLLDVTALNIDEICNVYYAPNQTANVLFPELGFLPFITNGTSMGALESSISYLETQTVINQLTRKMNVAYDWELFPVDLEGKQKLQVNCNGLCRIEYLPHIDPLLDSWLLYENEYLFLTNVSFARVCRSNAEYQASASVLGVGKEAQSIVDYWDKKVADYEEKFLNSAIIAYIQ